MKINHVTQQHPKGCAIACIAMVTGQTYAQAREMMGPEDDGFDQTQLFEALAKRGFAAQYISQREQINITVRKVWPLAPWAPSHLIHTNRHLIVMRHDGMILDPAHSPEVCKGRRLSFYPAASIVSMMGIFSVTGYPLHDKGTE